jgi:hypothetical protein
MILYRLGLIFNLTGSIFLGLHILGEKRLLKMEKFIINLPNTISILIIKTILSKFLRYKLKYSPKAQAFFNNLTMEVHNTGHSSENKAKIVLFSYIIPCFFISCVVWVTISPFMVFLYLAVKPLHFLQKQLKIESFFGLLGMLFLFLGFLFQFLV